MNREQPGTKRPPAQHWSTMNDSATSRSARQLARNKGLAWVSAITLGAGAAGALGAVALATSLNSATSQSASAATTSGTSTGTSSSQRLQAATAPTTTTSPPVATSGAS